MARKRHKPEEIVAKLREVDVLVSQGQNMSDAIRQIGVSEVTYYRWRQEFGGAPDPRFVVWRSFSQTVGCCAIRRFVNCPAPLPTPSRRSRALPRCSTASRTNGVRVVKQN